jgi:prepilin-type processing-associated H-X9-DG protein
MLSEVARTYARFVDGAPEPGYGTPPYDCSPSTAGINIFTGCVSGATGTQGNFATGFFAGRSGTVGTAADQYESSDGRHLAGANYLLADGHVKWYKGSAVSAGYAAAAPVDGQVIGTGGGNRAAGTANNGYQITFSPI